MKIHNYFIDICREFENKINDFNLEFYEFEFHYSDTLEFSLFLYFTKEQFQTQINKIFDTKIQGVNIIPNSEKNSYNFIVEYSLCDYYLIDNLFRDDENKVEENDDKSLNIVIYYRWRYFVEIDLQKNEFSLNINEENEKIINEFGFFFDFLKSKYGVSYEDNNYLSSIVFN